MHVGGDDPTEWGTFELMQRVGKFQFLCNKNFHSVVDAYNKYHGLGKFLDVPIKGGVAYTEKRLKKQWRGHFSSAEEKFFTRLRSVVRVLDVALDGEDDRTAVFARFEGYLMECRSLPKLVTHLQSLGLMTKRARRGRQA